MVLLYFWFHFVTNFQNFPNIKMDESVPLLLPTSFVFKNANLIDCIRQSYIDLNETTDRELIEMLLNEAIKYLEKDISFNAANELIALITKCFKYLPDPLQHFDALFQKLQINTNFIITIISVLSYLINDKLNLDLSKYNSFIDESIKEVQSQLNKNTLFLFNHEIPFQIKNDIILAVILSVKPTDEIITAFTPFLLSDEIHDNTKIMTFASKTSDKELMTSLLLKLLTDKKYEDQTSTSSLNNEIITRDNFEDDEIISNFLKCKNPELDNTIKKSLFQKIISEKSNLLGYFQIIFENINGPTTKPLDLLKYFINEYELSQDDFVKVLDNVLVLHPSEKVFIEKAKYKPLNLPDSEFNRTIINRLFEIVTKDPSNYQAYYCLECIASDFPFVFSLNPVPLFDSVLPAFDNFKLIFEKKTDDEEIEKLKVNKAKASIAAVSTLLFSLNSTKVMDCFVEWFFKNSEKFSLSQIYCFINVFISISSTNCLQYLTALFKKYKLFDCISKFLLREVPKSLFGENFNNSLYTFLIKQHKLAENLSTFETIFIDANVNRNDLMYEVSGKHLTHSQFFFFPLKNNLLQIESSERKKLNNEPLEFLENNSKLLPNWIMKN